MAKLLTNVYLINWYLFGEKSVPIQGHTAILGSNGAGKSSFIDAIQTVLLTGDKRFIRYNPGVDERSRRSLMSYAVGVWKETEDEGELKKRGNCHSYISLEFTGDAAGSVITAGVGIEAQWPSKAGIETHFILKGRPVMREYFIREDGSPLPPKEFVRQMKQRFGPDFLHYENHEPFLNALMFHLSSDGVRFHPEKFRRNFRNALIFKKMDSVEEFFKEYILEDRPIDTKRLKRSLDVFREIKEKAEKTEERINHLKRVAGIISDIEKHGSAVLMQKLVSFGASLKKHRNRMAALKEVLDESDRKWQQILNDRDRITKEREFASQEISRLTIELHKDSRYAVITGLRKDVEHNGAALKTLNNKLARVISEIKAACSNAAAIIHAAGDEKLLSLVHEIVRAADTKDCPSLDKSGRELVGMIDPIRSRSAERIAELSLELTGLKDRLAVIDREIEELKKGVSPLPPEYKTLRDILTDTLRNAGFDDPVVPVCDLLDIRDKTWQTAIETFLGNNRFSLIVHPDRFVFCLSVYRRLQKAEGIYGARLIDAGKCLKEARPAAADSAAVEVIADGAANTKDEIKKGALAYMSTLLGNVIKADSDEELRSHARALTKDCMIFANYAAQRLRPQQRLVFGRSGKEAYLRSLAKERDESLARIKSIDRDMLNEKNTAAFFNALHDALRDIDSILPDSDEAARLRAGIVELNKEIERLEQGAIADSEAEIKRLEETRREMGIRLSRLEADDRGNRDEHSKVEHEYTECGILARQAADAARALSADEPVTAMAEERISRELEKGLVPDEIERMYFKKAEGSEKKRAETEKAASNELLLYAGKYEDHQITDEMKLNPLTASGLLDSEVKRLEDMELAKYKDDSRKALDEAQRIFQEEFIYRLRDNLLMSENQRSELNAILKRHTFHGERYYFERRPNPRYKLFLDMVMDSGNARMNEALFSEGSGFRQNHQAALSEIERLFGVTGDLNAEHELQEIADYRNYYRHEIAATDEAGNKTTLTHRLRTGSGGEIQTPFYVAISSALAYTYRIGEVNDGIRLAVFDEAFNKMDQGNVENALSFMKELGLQIILAAPDDKANIFLPHVDTALMMYRSADRIRLDCYKTKEKTRELYEQSKSPA